MGRLTRRTKDHLGRTGIAVGVHDVYKYSPYYEAMDKLAHYEDMEEQLMESAEIDIDHMACEFMHDYKLKKENRLIELPCAVGEEVWIGHKIYSFGESVVNVMYDSVSSIIVAMQDGFIFGRTKEEAEAKLKERAFI